MRKLILSSLCLTAFLGGLLPAQAVNIQHMKQRVEKNITATAPPFFYQAQKLTCKTQKKPICYANRHAVSGRFGLVQIHRLEQKDIYLFFQQEASNKWKLKGVAQDKDLNSGFLVTHAEITEAAAKVLLKKFSAS